VTTHSKLRTTVWGACPVGRLDIIGVTSKSLTDLLSEIRACTVCAPSLEHEPRPIVQAGSQARIVIIGSYAQKRYITDRKKNLTETVANWAEYLPNQVVLPHPSPRNQHWLTKNPWFEAATLPAVRKRIDESRQRLA